MKLLLVDDDALNRELWTLLLEIEGHGVEVAESGDAAVALLERARLEGAPATDAVLADVQMPGMVGAALAAALRSACGRGAATVLLAMSGSQPARAMLAGFDGFLLKPFTVEALEAAIAAAAAGERVIDLAAGGPEAGLLAVVAEEEPATVPDGAVLDETVFARLLASMPQARAQELYALCLGDARSRIEGMRAAAASRNEAAFRSGAHAIKGGCGMIGAVELKHLAGVMEGTGPRGESFVDDIATGCIQTQLEGFLVACARLEGMLVKRWAPVSAS